MMAVTAGRRHRVCARQFDGHASSCPDLRDQGRDNEKQTSQLALAEIVTCGSERRFRIQRGARNSVRRSVIATDILASIDSITTQTRAGQKDKFPTSLDVADGARLGASIEDTCRPMAKHQPESPL